MIPCTSLLYRSLTQNGRFVRIEVDINKFYKLKYFFAEVMKIKYSYIIYNLMYMHNCAFSSKSIGLGNRI